MTARGPLRTSLAVVEGTVLDVGAVGHHRGASFTLVGRTCVRGLRGALWNEWTARFDDGRTLFLAESLAGLTLYDEGTIVPPWESLRPGPLDTGYVVVERGTATRIARFGEDEEAPPTYRYVDLSSRAGTPATIDLGAGAARVYVGAKLTLADLGLAPRRDRPRFLPTPEVSRPKGVETWLAIGDEGELDGIRYQVVGMLSRSTTTTTGDRLFWDEYLLHEPRAGFRWLVVADGHWGLVMPVEPGLVIGADTGVTLGGVHYAPLTEGAARIEWAQGEMPWEVAIGDEARVQDLGHDDRILTREETDDELAWSLATPLPPDAIARAFGKRSLPRPR